MFRSLRWRLIAAFGLVILLTTLLNGLLSFWVTTNRFNLLITDQSQQQAQSIARLLELNYAYRGDWGYLNDLLAYSDQLVTSDAQVMYYLWTGQVDGHEIIAQTLQMDSQTLSDKIAEAEGGYAQVARERQVDPQALVQAIIRADQAAVDQAVADGKLSPEAAAQAMQVSETTAIAYVFGYNSTYGTRTLDWDELIAKKLGMPVKAFQKATTSNSVVEVAKTKGVSAQQLVDVLVAAEKQAAQEQDQNLNDKQAELSLKIEANTWIYQKDDNRELSFVDWGLSWYLGVMTQSKGRLLITNPAGQVLFDSAGDQVGEQLPASMLAQGAPLRDRVKGASLGTAIVAANRDYYSASQTAFLQGVAWSLVATGLLTGVIALLLGWLIARQVLIPVTALSEATRRLAQGDKSVILPVQSSDELGQMSQNFNHMAQALHEQQELRRRLVDDISHEIKTPLSIIKLELKANIDGLQTPQEAAAHIEREINLLQSLLEDLTYLAETDLDALQLAREPVDLSAITRAAVARWQPQAEANGIDLRLTQPTKPLPLIQADPFRLNQVLSNLITNALQHTSPGGQIEVCLRQEPASNGHKSAGLITTVRDTGCGIAPVDLPHIFERFYRTDRSRTRHTGGRGLGLAIVHQIIELHGGQVWAESQPGQGSTFGYRLPL
ncbi:MAG: ATP-binding protein [Anaerolineae bacterium]